MQSLGEMNIYKANRVDCSNDGISSRHDKVQVWPDLDDNAPDNAVVIIEDKVMGKYRIRAVPANMGNRWSMFGGTFIYTSNGVVPHSGDAIKLHDRFE